MEPKEFDKIFREQIEQDSSDFSFEELEAKEKVWDTLDINEADQAPVKSLANRKWWLLAAALLFLIFGSGIMNMFSRLQTQSERYSKMEQEYKKVADEFKSVRDQLAKLDTKLDDQKEVEQKQVESIVSAIPAASPQIIEKVIYVKDTIYSIQQVEQVANVEYIRDTIFVIEKNEELENQPTMLVDSESKNKIEIEASAKENKPKKVEFVIGNKKKIEAPKSNRFDIQFNGTSVASKNKRKN
jgi:septal ring factor EnvC (AmiA/AmiB activator)